MNKRKVVREFLLSRRDGHTFTLSAAALATETDTKSVDNVCRPLVAAGALTKELVPGEKHDEYTINANALVLQLSKNNGANRASNEEMIPIKMDSSAPDPVSSGRLGGDPHIAILGARPKTRRRVRPPFIMAIDAEIAELESKVKRLKQVRRDFV